MTKAMRLKQVKARTQHSRQPETAETVLKTHTVEKDRYRVYYARGQEKIVNSWLSSFRRSGK